MKELILLKSGEIMLKGLNRKMFEKILMNNARSAIEDLGEFSVFKGQSTFCIQPRSDGVYLDEVIARLKQVFGFSAIARAGIVEKDFEAIKVAAVEYLKSDLESARTFKVHARRSDKKFPLNSPEICSQLGGHILRAYPHLKVDVHHPDLDVVVEVRDKDAYIHSGQQPGAGGLPVGCSGKGMLLLSGGIDSPVAGWMLAKRGVELLAIHFESPPYTSARALQKVEMLSEKLTPWAGRVRLCIVPFTRPQEEMKKNCPDPLITLIMRRLMMRIAEEIAVAEGCGALITGESVGQVASQTLMAMACTDNVVKALPVLRPLVGMDKSEIIVISRKIDTYDTSILPYEDCCTVFTPRRPKTNPNIRELAEAEKALDIDGIVEECVKGAQWKTVG